MPCVCWYIPSDPEKRIFKYICQNLVDLIKDCEKEGDPIGIGLDEAIELITHLYKGKCKEKKK